MMKMKLRRTGPAGLLSAGAIATMIICTLTGIIGGFAIPYSVNSWLEWAGKPEDFKFWHGFLIGLVPRLGLMSIPVAVITFIVGFFMV